MSFTKIGLPHKIIYASKNFTSGLSDITIRIKKPNGSVHQNGTMTEVTGTGFEGIYEFSMSTGSTDPEGEYIVSIVSPTEGHKVKTKVTVLDGISGSGGSSDVSDVESELDVTRPEIKLNSLTKETELSLKSELVVLNIEKPAVELIVDVDSLKLDITTEEIELELECNA